MTLCCAADEEYELDFDLDAIEESYLGRREYDDRRERLIDLLDRMKTYAPNWSGDDEMAVSADAANTAKALLNLLKPDRELPKVAADGDGDVLLVWDDQCIVTVQDRMLHMVEWPGTPHAEYVDAQPFFGRYLPVSVLRAIPMK